LSKPKLIKSCRAKEEEEEEEEEEEVDEEEEEEEVTFLDADKQTSVFKIHP
jgi:hypothetical protein